MGLNMRTLFGVLLQLFCAVALFAADDRVVCRPYAGIAVALTPGGPVSDTVTGELCATRDELVWLEAINYADVDGVIVTGAAHAVTIKFLSANALYPAVNDPKFASSGLDAGYLTAVPGTCTKLFFSLPDVDPAVIAADEIAKDVVQGSELATGLPIVTSTATLAIGVPVLTILGSNDFTTRGLSSAGVNFDRSSAVSGGSQ
jgi:hypothetical protein